MLLKLTVSSVENKNMNTPDISWLPDAPIEKQITPQNPFELILSFREGEIFYQQGSEFIPIDSEKKLVTGQFSLSLETLEANTVSNGGHSPIDYFTPRLLPAQSLKQSVTHLNDILLSGASLPVMMELDDPLAFLNESISLKREYPDRNQGSGSPHL